MYVFDFLDLDFVGFGVFGVLDVVEQFYGYCFIGKMNLL